VSNNKKTKKTTRVWPTAISLIVLGLALLSYHILKTGIPLVPDYSFSSWLVEAKIKVQPQESKSSVTLFLPASSENFVIQNEQFVSDG